jgi:exosortase H (IPTLxxWG-CTERM-specific)
MGNLAEDGAGAIDRERVLSGAWRTKAPILRFAAWFLAIFLPLNVLYTTHVLESGVFQTYLAWIARTTGWVLSLLGTDSQVVGTEVRSSLFSIRIIGGCDGLQPCALFFSAIAAFPARLRAKLLGLLVAIPLLLLFNLARIVFLFYAGRSYPDLFDLLHTDVWQALFVGFSLFLWIAWARWASRR